jgi:thiosulfate/3-mercaptopyruvate sulfurtransferase
LNKPAQASLAWNGQALVDSQWLQNALGQPGLVLLDCTYYLPGVAKNAKAEYEAGHIPSARFLDYASLNKTGSALPNTMPEAAQFSAVMSGLGVSNTDLVVVYDQQGMSSAPRIWFLLRAFGHSRVAVLDGGLPAWNKAGGKLESGMAQFAASNFSANGPDASCVGIEAVQAALSERSQILDARSQSRFAGETPEPRPGLRSGHIPGSRNLPYESLVGADGSMLSGAALQAKFADAGMDWQQPVICSCGSGVSACVLALGLHRLGNPAVRVYDGSWTEWGSRQDLPLETGPINTGNQAK